MAKYIKSENKCNDCKNENTIICKRCIDYNEFYYKYEITPRYHTFPDGTKCLISLFDE